MWLLMLFNGIYFPDEFLQPHSMVSEEIQQKLSKKVVLQFIPQGIFGFLVFLSFISDFVEMTHNFVMHFPEEMLN